VFALFQYGAQQFFGKLGFIYRYELRKIRCARFLQVGFYQLYYHIAVIVPITVKFFQVCDKGFMEDGEGRFIDFKNTLIILTTNAGTDLIAGLCKDPDLMPDPEGMASALRAPLLKVFPPALLGRLVTIPYYPLSDDMLGKIVKLQLDRIKKRVEARYKIPFEYGEDVVKLVVSRCTESESGGRMIDAILTNTMLPDVSRTFLDRMMKGETIGRVLVRVKDGQFDYEF